MYPSFVFISSVYGDLRETKMIPPRIDRIIKAMDSVKMIASRTNDSFNISGKKNNNMSGEKKRESKI
jgi:hypothetical protein